MRPLRGITVATAVATALALSSCGFAGDDDASDTPSVNSSPTTAGPAFVRPSATAAAVRAGLRPSAVLTTALLSATEVGDGATAVAVDSNRADMGGCPDLDGLLGQGRIRHPDQQWAEADFGTALGMPVVLEGLSNEPAAEVTADLTQAQRGIASCKSAQDPADGMSLQLQPASFPISSGPSSPTPTSPGPAPSGNDVAALRSTSTVSGVTVTQYIVLARVAPDVLLSFCYGSTDEKPDAATAVFQKAVAKASAQLAPRS